MRRESAKLTLSMVCDFAVEVLQMVMSRSGGSHRLERTSQEWRSALVHSSLDWQGEWLERRAVWRLVNRRLIGKRGRRDAQIAGDKRGGVLAG